MVRTTLTKRFAGLPGPADVIYEPFDSDIQDFDLRALYLRWLSDLASGKARPGSEILDFPEMAPLHRNLMLLEVIAEPGGTYDYRYRVYGTDIARRYGKDMTGHLASAFPSGVFRLFSELYETAIVRRIVVHSLHAPPLNVNVKRWERLIFPLGADEIKFLLVVNLPQGRRREDEPAA